MSPPRSVRARRLIWVAGNIAEGCSGHGDCRRVHADDGCLRPEHAGTDYTLLACVVIVVGMIASYCGAAIADAFGYAAAFATGAVLALAGCLALVWVVDRYEIVASRSRVAHGKRSAPLHHRGLRQLDIERRALAGPTLRQTRPPMRSTALRTSASPMPVPGY